ncbi:hypothetical protein DV736_g6598, partial [Chaetothyriales sp. CBS 134916]
MGILNLTEDLSSLQPNLNLEPEELDEACHDSDSDFEEEMKLEDAKFGDTTAESAWARKSNLLLDSEVDAWFDHVEKRLSQHANAGHSAWKSFRAFFFKRLDRLTAKINECNGYIDQYRKAWDYVVDSAEAPPDWVEFMLHDSGDRERFDIVWSKWFKGPTAGIPLAAELGVEPILGEL